jgi:hypothetical protein
MATNVTMANKLSPSKGVSKKAEFIIEDDDKVWYGCAKKTDDGILCYCNRCSGEKTYKNPVIWARDHQGVFEFGRDPIGSGFVVTKTTNAIAGFIQTIHTDLHKQIEEQKKTMTADEVKTGWYRFDYEKQTITFEKAQNKGPKKVPIEREPRGPSTEQSWRRGQPTQETHVAQPAQTAQPAHWAVPHTPSKHLAEETAEEKMRKEHERALKQAAKEARDAALAEFAAAAHQQKRDEEAMKEAALAKAREELQQQLEQKRIEEEIRQAALAKAREELQRKREKEIAEEAKRIAEIEAARENARLAVLKKMEEDRKRAELAEKKRLHEIQEDANEEVYRGAGLPYTRKAFIDPSSVQQFVAPQFAAPKFAAPQCIYQPPTPEQVSQMVGFKYGSQPVAAPEYSDPKYEKRCTKVGCNGVKCDYNHQGRKLCKNEFERTGGCTFVDCTFNHLKGYVVKMEQVRADFAAGKFKKPNPTASQDAPSDELSVMDLMDSATAPPPKPKKKQNIIDPVILETGPIVPALTHLDLGNTHKDEKEDTTTPTEEEVVTNAVKKMMAAGVSL